MERAVSFAAKIFSEDISDGAAVFLEPAACVLRSVRRSGVRNGDLIVVQGAGAMGLLHLLVLRATMPETKVVIIDPIAERRSFAEELGVFKALSPEEVNGLSKSINADAVFDTVGGAKVISIALKNDSAWRNRCSFAHASDRETAAINLNSIFKDERRIVGAYSGALTEQSEIFNLIEFGRLNPSLLITHTLPLDYLKRASRSSLAVKR